NALGRLAGTVLSGALYQWGMQLGRYDGLIACLWASAAFVVLAGLLSIRLPAPARVVTGEWKVAGE
ncbi:MAG: MFS transporter, partial [Chloroflexi bacterium]